MPSLRLKIKYNKNEGLIISPTELRENYLFGVPVCTNDGRKLNNQTIKQQITVAQKRIENLFSVKINRQVIEESKDFVLQEWNVWGYVKSTYLISYPDDLKGFINSAQQVNYPKEWLSIKKTEQVAIWRNLYIIPNSASVNGATMTQNSMVFNGIVPHLYYYGKSFLPNYWRLKYITGWRADEIPDDLVDLINKLAAVFTLAIIGNFLYGVGIASWNVSLDGVSQSIPLKSGKYGMFDSTMQLYLDDINNILENAKYIYTGITFDVL